MQDEQMGTVTHMELAEAFDEAPALAPLQPTEAPPISDKTFAESEEFKEIVSQFEGYYDSWQNHLLKMKKMALAYLNKEEESDNPYPRRTGSSKKIFNAAKVLVSRACNATLTCERMLGLKPYRISMEPIGDLSAQEKGAEIGMEVGNYLLSLSQWKRILCEKTYLDTCIYGNPYLKNAVTAGPMGILIPWITRPSPFRVFPDPTTDGEWEACYEILPTTPLAFKGLIGRKIIDADAAEKCTKGSVNEYDQYVKDLRTERKQESDSPRMSGDKYILVEGWKYLQRGKATAPTLYWIIFDLPSKTLLRFTPAPFEHGKIPVLRGSYMPVPETINSMGVAEALWGLQREYNRVRAQAATNSGLASNLALLLSRTSGIDRESVLQNAIGRVIMGNHIDPNNVRQLTFQSIIGDLAGLMNYYDADMQMTGGASDMALAMKAPDTARAAELMAGQLQLNLDLFTVLVSNTLLQPTLEQVWSNIQHLSIPEGSPTRIWSKLGKQSVGREELQGEYQVEVGDFLARARAQNVSKALTTTLAMAGQTGVQGDYPYLMRKILIGFGLTVDEAEKAFPQLGVMVPRAQGQPGGGSPPSPPAVAGQNQPTGVGQMQPDTGEGNPQLGPVEIEQKFSPIGGGA